ncbi:MAG: hypothetical protein Q8P49_02080, partial [Candidatus Liptonbacteria bacterium]|nr:hypothetical protein [Candidatus Liptonbacteria bacterium]
MSELRQDLISGDWVLIAPGRAARPKFLEEKKQPRKPSQKSTCPFENLKESGNWPPILSWPSDNKWEIVVVQNKYPALTHQSGCAVDFRHGPYSLKTAAGEHDLVITRDHAKNFADLKPAEALRVLQVLQELHMRAAKDKCNVYISSFANWGPGVGASIYHPHYQVLTLPIIPPHIVRSLAAEERYCKKHGRCARCTMIQYDRKEKKRVVEENQHAIAVTPFASKEPFEVRILPKRHLPYFGKTPLADLKGVSSLLQSLLRRMKKNLNDPDFNFFIHGAPFDTFNKFSVDPERSRR